MIDLTYEDWCEKYKPIKNHIVPNDDTTSFETYGDELEFVRQQPDNTIWTEMDGDEGVYIVTGYHFVNRICYYITEVPWQNDDESCVTVCKFVVCDCYDVNNEDEEPDEDCDRCYGDGTYTDWK